MGFDFNANEWLIVGLAALFGLLIGMALASGGGRKHKERHREAAGRVKELERDNQRLTKEVGEHEKRRDAAARELTRDQERVPARDADRTPARGESRPVDVDKRTPVRDADSVPDRDRDPPPVRDTDREPVRDKGPRGIF